MKRVSGLLMISLLLMLVFSTGCEEETAASETGFKVSTTDCLTFGIWIFIDGQYQGMISSEEPHFFEIPAGTYVLSGRSNAAMGGTEFCWSMDLTVSDGQITYVVLDCEGAECVE